MNLKKIATGAALGVGAVVFAPVAIGGLATVATATGAYTLGALLTTGAVDLALVSTGTGAAVGAIAGAASSMSESEGEKRGLREGTIKTSAKCKEKIEEVEIRHKKEMEEKNNLHEKEIKEKDDFIDYQDSVIKRLSEG